MKKDKKKISILLLAVLLGALFLLPIFPLSAAAEPDYSTIRVKLSIGAGSTSYITSMNITLSGSYKIKEKPDAVLESKTYTVKISGTSVGLYDGSANIYSGDQFTLLTQRAAGQANTIKMYNLRYNANLSYLGDLQFKSYAKYVNGANNYYIMAINYAYIEEYLYGVVPHEMSNSWPMEALKAQAVAARGYAIRQINASASYDVGDTSADQVYKGYNPANNNAIDAVNATARQVVKFDGSLVETFFAASNGGAIEIAPNVWSPVTPKPYQVVKADPYDRRNPSSPQEQKAFSKAVADTPDDNALLMIKSNYILSKLVADGKYNQNGEKLTQSSVSTDFTLKEIMSMTGSVPADHLQFKDNGGACTHVDKVSMHVKVGTFVLNGNGEAVPQEMEYDITVPVTDFEAWGVFTNSSLRIYLIEEIKDNAGNVTGYNLRHARYGHGIGLSQRGAQQMANESIGYRDIIQFYFPNTVLEETQYIHAPETSPAPPPPAPPVKPEISATCKVTSTTLNVRSGPGTNNGILGVLAKNNTAEIVKTNYTADWHQIWYNNQLAYIHKSYVAVITPAVPAPAPEPSPSPSLSPSPSPQPAGKPAVVQLAKVKVSKAYLRNEPSASSSKAGTLTRNKYIDVTVRYFSKDWHQVWYNGKAAYVYRTNVTLMSGTNTAVKASSAQLKKTASSKAATLATLQKGVVFKRYYYTGSYMYVNYNGTTGYINKSALKGTSPGSSSSSSAYGYVTTSGVKLRSKASTGSSVIATVKKGAKLQVTKKNYNSSWHQVRYNGKTAYISKSYLRF